ncbi:nucleolar MIF4G domain-containing protein 1-like protein [Dinothrombium tinctorium]|uniref:Nucleolar MIF4G domain-containing protein 1-like protein n=1 Tax=Dinothrombium tinctorium TaxID=1965070 RepID=A0A3S3P3K8_9ACAR|nr:nucleolar MIF4G domain-containing protein 1-like protein [Dinothrombium tinctorium]
MATQNLDDSVVRSIRGLFNRLALPTLPYVSSQIELLFRKHSLNEVCQSVLKCCQQLILIDVCMSPQKLVLEASMLIAALHTSVGEEVGGHMVHNVVKMFDEAFRARELQQLESKKLDNTTAFICSLYACNVISCQLLFDLIEKLCDSFNDKSIELLILILKMVGFALRKHSPSQMKQTIVLIRDKAKNVTRGENKRVNFMLDTLIAIRNNNILKITSDSSGIDAIDIQMVKSGLKNCLKTNTSVNCLHGSYNEILSGNRWWMKGTELKEFSRDVPESKEIVIETEPNINEKLCRKLRLNTPLRKQLFHALITANDYIEASQRMLVIAKKQFSEIVNVSLHVALHQKEFNQFYIYLLKHLSSIDRKFKMAVLYSIKDKISELSSLSEIQQNNLSLMCFELIKCNVITINVLKVIEFSEMDHMYSQFLKSILSSILNEDPSTIERIFSKIASKDSFATALRLFITCFVNSEFKF